MCVVEYNTGIDTNHEEVIEWGKKRAGDMKVFVAKMVEMITNNPWKKKISKIWLNIAIVTKVSLLTVILLKVSTQNNPWFAAFYSKLHYLAKNEGFP